MASPADYARLAIQHTRSVLGETPSNNLLQRIRTFGSSTKCVKRVRKSMAPKFDQHVIKDIRRIAGKAKQEECGNCGEYASVTFEYLMLNNCPFHVELAEYENPGNHMFVIVGRPIASDIARPSTWGLEAVVADAWAGNVIAARDYWSGMPQFPDEVTSPQLVVRWHPAGQFPPSPYNTDAPTAP